MTATVELGSPAAIIDGESVRLEATIDVVDPATEEVVARIPRGAEAEIDAAVTAARRSGPGTSVARTAWRQTARPDRYRRNEIEGM